MTNPREVNEAIAALIRAAKGLLGKAESLHGQPLYFDKAGRDVDMPGILDETAKVVETLHETDGIIYAEGDEP